jgi:hypothetical protein
MARLRWLCLLLLVSCDTSTTPRNQAPPPPTAPMANAADIRVFTDGTVSVDGKPATLDDVEETFAELEISHGTVRFYRERGGVGAKTAEKVLQGVFKHRLQIRLSAEPDYSDVP